MLMRNEWNLTSLGKYGALHTGQEKPDDVGSGSKSKNSRNDGDKPGFCDYERTVG